MNTETAVAKEDSYFDRNSPWLYPAWATFIIVMTPLLVAALDVQLPLPGWVSLAGAVAGSFLTGLRSMQVDTASSKVARFISAAAIIGSLVAFVML